MSKKLKLTYFRVRGKAELTRLMLIAKGVEFSDVFIEFEDWPKVKPTIQSGQLPIIELPCGTILNESGAIVRYFARKYDLMGSNEMEIYKSDRAFCTLEDVFRELADIFHETDEAKKQKLKKELTETHLPVYLNRLTNYLNEVDGGFFLGSKPSYADLHLVNILDHFDCSFEKFPKIAQCYRKVLEHFPKIKEHQAKRPVTVI